MLHHPKTLTLSANLAPTLYHDRRRTPVSRPRYPNQFQVSAPPNTLATIAEPAAVPVSTLSTLVLTAASEKLYLAILQNARASSPPPVDLFIAPDEAYHPTAVSDGRR